MKLPFRLLLCALLPLVLTEAHSEPLEAQASPAKAVHIAFTMSMSPYLNQDHRSGIEYEIIEAAFRATDFKVSDISNVHYKRAINLLASKQIDAVVSNQNNQLYYDTNITIYGSEPTLNYVDCAITLNDSKIVLDSISDYEQRVIRAFKTASEVLGQDFKEMTMRNANYSEEFDQGIQPKMLYLKRIDVLISDKNIFLSELEESVGKNKAHLFNYKTILPVTPRNLKLNDPIIKDGFNHGLEMIKSNGTYQKIIDKYQSQYQSEC